MAPLYSRYVPPKATVSHVSHVSQKNTTLEPRSNAQQSSHKSTSSEDHANGRKKRKRIENHKDDLESSTSRPIVGQPPEDETPIAARPEKKVKKTKTSKDKQDFSAINEEKHNGVLSKYQKALQRPVKAAATTDDDDASPEEAPVLHDLTPLPQPVRAATPEYVPTFSALPPWLERPTVIAQSATKPFADFTLSSSVVTRLEAKRYTNAFAIQTALLPLLLPHPYLSHLPPNDVCVNAPTGSGKTLAYTLPIVESLRNKVETRLRAVIVVPTRELVTQAQSVATMCAAGSGLRIGIAVGNQNLAAEQETLIKKSSRFDPEGYKSLMDKAMKRIRHQDYSDTDDDEESILQPTMLHDIVHVLPEHVPTYSPNIDILICTPGRLVEHMSKTVGFHLDDVEWLVIDEADRLLDQSFQEWVSKVVGALRKQRPEPPMPGIDPLLQSMLRPKDRYVRKVILSATMTRDVAKLSALDLRRPSMIVVKSEDEENDAKDIGAVDGKHSFELPRTLSEFAVPVGEGSDKPLFLIELLRSRILQSLDLDTVKDRALTVSDDEDTSDENSDSDSSSDDSSSSDSDSDSDSSVSKSDSDSDTSTSTSTSDSSSLNTTDLPAQKEPTTSQVHASSTTPTILIFTSSTESAARLHHLLTTLLSSIPSTLLTRSTPSSLSSLFHPSTSTSTSTSKTNPPYRLLISTDRASRGLDLAALTHVINYSLPRSLSSYIHRVGRTARAGRNGQAWTLFEEKEGRWFWNEIARGGGIGRRTGVERVNLRLGTDMQGEGEMRREYERALEGMRGLVGRRNGKKKGQEEKDGGSEIK